MNDYKKIMETYQAAAPDKAEALAAAAVVQAEIFGWILAQMVKKGLAKEEETEVFLKDLRHRAGPGAQADIYDLVLKRFFAVDIS